MSPALAGYNLPVPLMLLLLWKDIPTLLMSDQGIT